MKATKITSAEIAPIKVAALPSRPTAPTAFGGRGYSASDMKAAFDRLPLFIADRLNLLIDDIRDGEVLEGIPSGISEGHTVKELVGDVTSGRMAAYLTVLGEPLTEVIQQLRESIRRGEADDSDLRTLIDGTISVIGEMSDCIGESYDKAVSVGEESVARDAEISLIIEENKSAADRAIANISARVAANEGLLEGVSTLLDELHLYAEDVSGGAKI